MVPNGWKLTSLGEVCSGKLQTGPFGSQLHAHEYTNEGVPVLMPKDLINFRPNHGSAAKIPVHRAEDLKKHTLKSGDILFSRRGDVARFALIESDLPISLCGTGCLKATPNQTHSPLFLSYFLQKNAVRKWLEQNAVGQTMPNINTAILAELPLMVASCREEEDKIAQILSTWDRGIATTEKLIDASKQQKKALMQQLLTGKKRLGHDEGTYTFKQTRYGAIPTDWAYIAIKDIAVQKSEKNSKGLNLPVLSCSKYDGFVDSLKYFKKKVYSDDTSGYRIISKGCFGFPANHIEEGSIGLQNLYDKGIVSPIYVVFQANANLVENRFLYAILKTDHYRQIFSAATNASVDRRGSLRWKEFSAIHVSLPSLEEQKAIADVLELANKEIKLLEAKLAHLKQEKKALMQQLLTGKRRVSLSS